MALPLASLAICGSEALLASRVAPDQLLEKTTRVFEVAEVNAEDEGENWATKLILPVTPTGGVVKV